ncbi:MAG: stage 0 sporulation protein [bacterium]|nr:stage 0 sporulation protein [bacterium]
MSIKPGQHRGEQTEEKTVVDILLCSSRAMHCYLGLLDSEILIEPGKYCILETETGLQLGQAISMPYKLRVGTRCRQKKLFRIVRLAQQADIEKYELQVKKEKEAYQLCREEVEEREIGIKIVNVEYHPEENTYYCFYTAEKRIDCRELAKDIAHILKAKIEIRQIGARDEGSLLGGIGSCGLQLCCTMISSDELPSVSMKMAKAQNLALNPQRISGLCGRLMCCLAYEFDAYQNNVKPKGRSKPQDNNASDEEHDS